jgi:hypothetical protein
MQTSKIIKKASDSRTIQSKNHAHVQIRPHSPEKSPTSVKAKSHSKADRNAVHGDLGAPMPKEPRTRPTSDKEKSRSRHGHKMVDPNSSRKIDDVIKSLI